MKKAGEKMIKKCVICGKEFQSPPSAKTITCSKECLSIRRGQVGRGRKLSEQARANMSEAAKKKGYTENLKKGTPASQKSPKSGRFETNINAKDWIIISPTGEQYECHSLINFIRKNPKLFDIDGSDKEVYRISKGFYTIKRNTRLNLRGQSYYGWTVEIPKNEKENKK
ncbi:MAG: hypothetical protein ACI4J6_06490 [Oscillospiraceae bacterium]